MIGITTNPYDAMLSIAKGDLKQIIWGGLLFDPGTHNPEASLPVGKFMRMNIRIPGEDPADDVMARATIFIQGWGWDLLFNPLFVDIDSANFNWNDQFNWLIAFYGGQNVPYPDGSTMYVIFDDDTYTSGTLSINDNTDDWHDNITVTFGEDAELDAIIDESAEQFSYDRTYITGDNWPIPDDDYNMTNKYMGALAFYQYTDDVAIGNLLSAVSVKGLEELESITLEDDSIATADYHGEDGDSKLVRCAVARDWGTNGVLGDTGIYLNWYRGYRNSDYISSLSDFDGADPRSFSTIVLELYPNVACIQGAPFWMVVRRVYISVEGDEVSGLKYRLVTDENNVNNMPFIYGGPWTKNGSIGEDYPLYVEEGMDYHDFSADENIWTVVSTPTNNGRGLQGTWKWDIGAWMGEVRDENSENPAVFYEGVNPQLNDVAWEGNPEYEDNMDYTHYVIVDTGMDWVTTNYGEVIGHNGLVNEFIVAGVDNATWAQIGPGEGADFNGWIDSLAETLGHAPTLDDIFSIIVPQGWLCFNDNKEDYDCHYRYEGWLQAAQY